MLALLPSAAAARGLPKPVAEALRAASVPAHAVAVVVQEVGAARASLSVNAGAAFNPASAMKLFTRGRPSRSSLTVGDYFVNLKLAM